MDLEKVIYQEWRGLKCGGELGDRKKVVCFRKSIYDRKNDGVTVRGKKTRNKI